MNAPTEILLFYDGPTLFGLRLNEVKEIINLRRVTPLPFSSPFLLGLANLKASFIPVLSPYLLVGGKGRYVSDVDYAAVVEADRMEVAIACQKILGVRGMQLPLEQDKGIVTNLRTAGDGRKENQRVRLLNIAELIHHSSDILMDEQYGVDR